MNQMVSYDFSNASVLITGGTSGIGLACAKAYQAAGAEVHVTGRKPQLSDYDTASELQGCSYTALDTADRAAVIALGESMKKLDILVPNAGGVLPNEWEPDGFDASVDVHLNSVFHLSCACKNALAASEFPGGASIVGIASMTSYFAMPYFSNAYGPAKAGLVQLMKTLGINWGELGIRANAVAAGLVQTGLTSAMFDAMPEAVEETLKRQGLKRAGVPEDIAAAVLFLSSPSAAWITGQTLPVDGGYSVGM